MLHSNGETAGAKSSSNPSAGASVSLAAWRAIGPPEFGARRWAGAQKGSASAGTLECFTLRRSAARGDRRGVFVTHSDHEWLMVTGRCTPRASISTPPSLPTTHEARITSDSRRLTERSILPATRDVSISAFHRQRGKIATPTDEGRGTGNVEGGTRRRTGTISPLDNSLSPPPTATAS